MENNNSFGTFTEKLIDVFGSLSVPIYYGSVNISKIFPDLFNNAVIDGSQYNLNDLISLINNMAGVAAVAVSPTTFNAVRQSIEYSKETRGYFDITTGPLSDLWKEAINSKKLILL